MIKKCQSAVSGAICNKWFIPALVVVTIFSMCTGLSLAGLMILAAVSAAILLFTDDTFAALCPVLLAVMCATSFYFNYLELLRYAWLFVPYAAAWIVHIVAYRGKFVRGKMLWSLLAVSLALITGGIGTISKEEYFSGVGLYYIIGLGIGMVPVYMLLCSRMSRERRYSMTDMFAQVLYGMAIIAAVVIIIYYVQHPEVFTLPFVTPFIKQRNFCTTVMLFGMPMCAIFVPRNRIHLLGMAFIYIFMLVGGSRSALLFGSVEFGLCLLFIFLRYPDSRKAFLRTCAYSAVPFLAVWLAVVYFVFLGAGGRCNEFFINPAEARNAFYRAGILDFISRPIFGYGIGNMKNTDIYEGIAGSISFYHNSILQVMGSLGAVGCAAYIIQFRQRVGLLVAKFRSEAFIVALSYMGILMISQTNPGLFCPFPTGLVLIMMFALLEFENSAQLASK